MKVFVTGGAGYIGTELVYKLAANQNISEIVIYDNLIRGNFNVFLGHHKLPVSKIKFITGELLDTRKLQKELKDVDIVFHLAAKVSTPFADHNPHEFDQVNNWGTAELIYTLEESPVKTLIYLSSTSVYGASDDEVTIEDVPNPKTFYGISKLRGEDHVRRLIKSNIKTYIFRCGNVYGYSKSMRFDSVINKFMFEANFSGRIRIFGDGHQSRSFIHIDRLSDFLSKMITNDLTPDTYNLVETTLSVNNIVEELREIYPQLETIFVNQNIKMRELKVKTDSRLAQLQNLSLPGFEEDLKFFKKGFTF